MTLKDLHIRITSKCNFNCPHCYASTWFSKGVSLSFDDFKSLILQAIPLGCKKVTFTGGEPLTYPSIYDSIRLCIDSGLRVEIETNGSLIPSLIDKLPEYLSKIEFAVSYDGEKMRPYHFDIKKNIEDLVSLGCNVKIQTVLTLLNISEIDEILEFSKKLNIRNRVFLTHSPTGNGKNLDSIDFHQSLLIIDHIRKKFPHAILELPDVLSGGSQKKCGWGVHRCEIMPNGDVSSCGPISFNNLDFKAGNIKESPLETIWNNHHFEYIRNLAQKDFTGLCSRCIFWTTCLGACRSISFSTGGDLLSSHPFCDSLFQYVKNKPSLFDERILSWAHEISNDNFVPSAVPLKNLV